MTQQPSRFLAFSLIVVLLSAACAPTPAQPAASTPVAPTPGPPTAVPPTAIPPTAVPAATNTPQAPQAFHPLAKEVCDALANELAAAVGAKTPATWTEAPFQDYASGKSGTGCHIEFTGTEATFISVSNAFDSLSGVFRGRAWTEDQAYQAGGPTGIGSGFRKDQALAIVGVIWHPAPGTNCPSDQPISACPLTPEQKLYTLTVDVAEASATSVAFTAWEP